MTLRKITLQLLASVLFFSVFTFMLACSGGDSGSDDNSSSQIPSNMVLETVIVGSSTQNPGGDGSGVVNFQVKADHAKQYKLLVDNQTLESSTGNFSYTFKNSGTYKVFASAYNGNQSASVSKDIAVTVNTGEMQLVWSDEFNYTGKPDTSKWTYNIGNGTDGWGNNELEYYTDREDNAYVDNGTLKINLKKESYEGYAYTSARLLTKGKFSFKYGKVVFRAKLPSGKGTWPALWMLGDKIDTVSWPACGEIDVMEHVGNQQNTIFSTLHYPGHSGASGVSQTTTLPTASSEFHVYTAEWTSSSIKFSIDGTVYHTFSNSSATPFNDKFFIIMNVAMGGNFGGAVDPDFSAASMEVDYVRVYQ